MLNSPFGYVIDKNIDIVMPYVNNQDKVWRKVFKDYCHAHKEYADKLEMIDGERFRDNHNYFELNLKLIRVCFPFIRKFYLIVSNPEQVEGMDLTGVEVVLHKDIMPSHILPTFNSSVIEMFIGNIKGLADRFIYLNDDMIPLRVLSESDFYDEQGRAKMTIYTQHETTINSPFREMVAREYKDVFKGDEQYLGDDFYLRPEHTATPMITSVVRESMNLYADKIMAHTEAFRNVEQFNQYLYIYEMIKRGLVVPSDLPFIYLKLRQHDFLNKCYMICHKDGSRYGMMCFNDDLEDNVLGDAELRHRVLRRTLELCLQYLTEKKDI